MKKAIIQFSALLLAVGLLGCSGPKSFNEYDFPQYTHKNDVAVGQFVYSATKRGLRENELEGGTNIGIGVADLARKATESALLKTGLVLNSKANLSIYGDVVAFKRTPSEGFQYKITYTIYKKDTKETVFSRQYAASRKLINPIFPNSSYVTDTCVNLALDGVSAFIADPDVRAILDVAPGASTTPAP